MLTMDHSPVTASKAVLGGTFVFRGTRVPAQTLVDYLNDGYGIEEFLEFFPSVQKDDVVAFLRLIQQDHENHPG